MKGWLDKYVEGGELDKNALSGVKNILSAVGDVTSAPARGLTYLATGKYQDPSEAMGITNPYGAFATDLVLDPMNLVGAGLLKLASGPSKLSKVTKAAGKLSKAADVASTAKNYKSPDIKLDPNKFPGPKNIPINPKQFNQAVKSTLSALTERGQKLDQVTGGKFNVTPDDIHYHGTFGGRPIVEVKTPYGSEHFYKSTGWAGKKEINPGQWQAFGQWMDAPAGTVRPNSVNDWFVKGPGFDKFYGSQSFGNVANSLDNALIKKYNVPPEDLNKFLNFQNMQSDANTFIPKRNNGGWLDKYNDGGPVQENYNDYSVSAGEGFQGDGYSNVGRNYSPAWGGQFQDGGKVITSRKDFSPGILSNVPGLSSLASGNQPGYNRHEQYGPLGDLYRYYGGLPLEHNVLIESQSKPAKSKDKNAKYISLNRDQSFVNEVLDNYKRVSSGKLDKGESKLGDDNWQVSGYSSAGKDAHKTIKQGSEHHSNAIGRYTLGKGKDEKGEYISYYDKFDQGTGLGINPGELLGLTKPFEIYDRIYVDPKTGKPKMAMGGPVKRFMQPTETFKNYGYNPKENEMSTEYSTSIGGPGEVYLVPGYRQGRVLQDPEGVFNAYGEHLGGPFKTVQAAEDFAKLRHKYVEQNKNIPAPFKTRDYAMGGSIGGATQGIPGATGFMYARTGSIPDNGKYAKKTMASAENGAEMQYYQNGLDWKPRSMAEGGEVVPGENEEVDLPSIWDDKMASIKNTKLRGPGTRTRFLPPQLLDEDQFEVEDVNYDQLSAPHFVNSLTPIESKNYIPKMQDRFPDMETMYYNKNAEFNENWSNLNLLDESSNKIKLNTGRFRGAKVPTNIIDELAKTSRKQNVPLGQLLTLMGRESMFGSGTDRNEDRAGSKTSLMSGWNVAEDYQPYNNIRFLADNKVPGIKPTPTPHGYEYEITDERAMNNYLRKNPKLLDQYKAKLDSTKVLGDQDAFDLAAKFLKKKGVKGYNPGDPNYTNLFNQDYNLLKQDKGLMKYVKQKGYTFEDGGSLELTKLDQLTNFTNYNTKQPGGWLDKYQ